MTTAFAKNERHIILKKTKIGSGISFFVQSSKLEKTSMLRKVSTTALAA